jgi:predicted MFS family arabinose efflux permease
MPRHHLLMLGAAVLVLANLMLAGASDLTVVLLGVALWGLHMGLTEGVFTAMIADAAPVDLRGTAFGVFNLMRGLLLLMASLIAGLMWEYGGPAATFITASVLAAFSMLLLMASRSMLRA